MTPASKAVRARKIAQTAIEAGRTGQDRKYYLQDEDDSKSREATPAFGWPGIEPKWTHGDKDGVGTAYASSSRIWFTLWNGIITEVYYPTVDHPQIRDLQYLITDGKTFFHEEKRDLKSKCERLSAPAGIQLRARFWKASPMLASTASINQRSVTGSGHTYEKSATARSGWLEIKCVDIKEVTS